MRPVGFSTLPRQSGIIKGNRFCSEMRGFDWGKT